MVGILERLDDTLLAMENLMPKSLKGMFRNYYKRFGSHSKGRSSLFMCVQDWLLDYQSFIHLLIYRLHFQAI